MARLLYGMTPADLAAQKVADPDATGGFVYGPVSVVFEVMTSRTGSTQETDLQDISSATITTVAPDSATGKIRFFGKDGYTGSYWLRDQANPSTERYLINPVDLADRASGGVTAHSALTGLTTGDDHTQYHNDARGDARYYLKATVDTMTAQATTTARGTVELATDAEVTAGTDTTRPPTAAQLRDEIDTHTHVAADITDVDLTTFAPVTRTPLIIRYTTTPPNRNVASSDPAQPVWWQGLVAPSKSGTGSTGAVTNDMYSQTAS